MRRAQRKEAGRSGSQGTAMDDEAGESTPLTRQGDVDPVASEKGPEVEMTRSVGDGSKDVKATTGDPEAGDDVDPAREDDGKVDDEGGVAGGAGTRRNRGLKKPGGPSESTDAGDIENNKRGNWMNMSVAGAFKVLDPIRADPIKLLQARKNRLERFAAQGIPEVHFVGQISSGTGLIDDATEGVCVRWKVDCGKAWEHLGGETLGQTQISYCRASDKEAIPFNHPLDVHFAAAGMHGWSGAPRIAFQCYKLDWHGRRLLVGYAFEHLPMTPGPHRMQVNLWRPVGSPEQELDAFLLGRVPALTSHEPLYESAWRERCRLVTEAAGSVQVDVFVATRNMGSRVGIDSC